MRRLLIVLLLAGLPFLTRAQGNAAVTVDVYYFHVTNRCHTCISIEEQVRKTLDTHFAALLKDSTVRLIVINCELPENKAIAEKYLAYGSTLALTRHAGGKESIEDITGWAFQKVGDKVVFATELKAKIEAALKP